MSYIAINTPLSQEGPVDIFFSLEWDVGRGVISCHFKYLAASDIRRFHMHTLIHIHKHRHITGESTYPPGLPGTEALDPYTYIHVAAVSCGKLAE